MSTGWIKLDRQVCDHWLWKEKPFSYGQAWTDLLINANHKPAKILIKSTLIELKRGDQARSERTLEKDWGWSRGKVRRFLVLLKNDGMIVQRAVPVTSVISICNYDSFQGNSTTGDTTNSTSVDTTLEPQAVHKQECKNEKKVRKDPIPYLEIKKLWNDKCPNLPSVVSLSDKRKAAIKKLWDTKDDDGSFIYRDLDFYNSWFTYCNQDAWYNGTDVNQTRDWRADFIFCLKVDNILKKQEA